MVGGPGRYLTSALEYHLSALGTVILASAEGGRWPIVGNGAPPSISLKRRKIKFILLVSVWVQGGEWRCVCVAHTGKRSVQCPVLSFRTVEGLIKCS